MAMFAIETGLRQSNVLKLTWNRVDLERHHVWIEAHEAKGRKAIAVPLNERAMSVLLACKGEHPEYVFTYAGRPISEIKTAFQAACVRAKLGRFRPDGSYEGFAWHGLRHTWATWHMQAGTPQAVLQQLGAWADPRMVQNYVHHSASYLAQFADHLKGKK
jgi:integrase